MIELKQAIDNYLVNCKARNMSVNTTSSYRNTLNSLRDFLQKNRSSKLVSDVKYEEISEYINTILATQLVSTSMATKIAGIKAFFTYCYKNSYVNKNVAKRISKPKLNSTLPQVIRKEDIIRVIESIPATNFSSRRDKAAIELLYGSGIRGSELASIKTSDYINRKNDMLRIKGKGNKERLVPLSQASIDEIDIYIKNRNANDNPYLFWSSRGGKLSRQELTRIVKKRFKNQGIDITGPHTLRHSFATHMLDAGAPLIAISHILGHSSLSSTQIYTQISIERLKESYKKHFPNFEKLKEDKDYEGKRRAIPREKVNEMICTIFKKEAQNEE